VLGGFLLLGLAAGGCEWSKDCTLDSSSPLWTAIDQSDLAYYEKTNFCECFATLQPSRDQGLVEFFETGTPQDIASALVLVTGPAIFLTP
jgi:hypothetical protein